MIQNKVEEKTKKELIEYLEWLSSPDAERLSDGTRITHFCNTVHKLNLTQYHQDMVSEVVAEAQIKEAYLWFNNWYDIGVRKADSSDFGHWATLRLQELAAETVIKQHIANLTGAE